ncbi:AsmA family protein [Noviherbaspirillum saxi]|nr:AsmA family protein [Noviherbaspirillum saxi]
MKLVLGTIAGLIGLLILALVILSTADLNRAKPWINERVSAATERSFAINGDLSLSWTRPLHQQQGWKRFVPWPHFQAKDVVLGNPDWAATGPEMARIGQVDFGVNLLALLRKTIVLHSLSISQAKLVLEHDKGDRNNWTFPKKEETESKWQFRVQDLMVREGNVRYVDPGKKADLTVSIDTEEDSSMSFKAAGKFNNEKLSGSGKTGSLLSLQEKNVKFPVEALLKVGETTIIANGTLTEPAHLSALDLDLKILGASMADLFPLSGVLLPTTPKFSTEGRVVGNLTPGAIHLRYEKFKGKVGSSDIGGTLEYRQQKPRPLLVGDVMSNHLDLGDLGALIGTGDESGPRKNASDVKQPPDKVLPVSPFKTERWDKMDVDVKFTGRKIVRAKSVPLDNLHTKIDMKNGVLTLAPLNFGVAGGRITTDISIDGRKDPANARMKVTARGLKLKQMFPDVESMQASFGEINGNAQLTAAGNSVAALLGSSNGEIKSLITQGSISKFILEAMGLNIGSAVVAKLFGDRQVQLNCMAADFGVKDGLMQTRTFVVDTQDATILVDGHINFASEEMNLKIWPESKGIRIISLRSPLHVEGTFKKPDLGIDKGVVALKAGAAIALGTIAAPVAALLALINPGPGQDPPCKELLADAGKKPVAPAPDKSAASTQQKMGEAQGATNR